MFSNLENMWKTLHIWGIYKYVKFSNKFENFLLTKSFFGFHNWEVYRKFYVFNRFLTSSPDWELWHFFQCGDQGEVSEMSVETN